MSSTITPKPREQSDKKVFGVANQGAYRKDDSRKGTYIGDDQGLYKTVSRHFTGKWYSGDPKYRDLLESYYMAICGERSYGSNGLGATFGFLTHVARRLPAPILVDDPKLEEFLWAGNGKPTACVDTSGRMWMSTSFFKEMLQEEARDKIVTLPVLMHEYLHIALNHVSRLHNYPHDISNQAKDKVINPMAAKMFDSSMQANFSDIFKLAHGNNPADSRFKDLSEETICRLMLQERNEALENLGTIRIKNLIIQDGPVNKITKIKAGKDEIKDFDTVVVTVQDMGMMDKIDTEFECATMEVENIDNRLKVRRRKGASGESEEEAGDSPIEIPVESDPSDGNGNGKSKGKKSDKASDSGKGDGGDPQDGTDTGDGDYDNSGRKSLDDVQKSKSGQKSSSGGSSSDGQDPSEDDASQGAGQDVGDDQAGQKNKQGQGSSQGDGQGDDQGNESDQASSPQGGKPSNGGKSKGFKGSADDLLGSMTNGNPLSGDDNHEVDLEKLGQFLEENGYEGLSDIIKPRDFEQGQVDRVMEIALREAAKERLLIGSGYAGGHIEDYVHTVVRPDSVYKVNWLRRATEFLQGVGTDITSTFDDYGIYTYIDPTDIGMPADEGVYFPGNITQKPEGAFFIIVDTSGSIWADQRRLAHLAAFALGVGATQSELTPDIHIVGADTVMSGKPVFLDPETIAEACKTGIPMSGGGGTDYETPINHVMQYCKENDIKPLGLIYLGDFEVGAPDRRNLPEDLPPVFFLGMPHDVIRADEFIKGVKDWAIVETIKDDITLDFNEAKDKAESHQGIGHQKIQ